MRSARTLAWLRSTHSLTLAMNGSTGRREWTPAGTDIDKGRSAVPGWTELLAVSGQIRGPKELARGGTQEGPARTVHRYPLSKAM